MAIDPPEVDQWFKSSYSGGNETECVECSVSEHRVVVRDSKRPAFPNLSFRPSSWRAFVGGVRDGEDGSGPRDVAVGPIG
ncbi:DUF397 domain-containing protein [Streptomyces sp. NPDC056600]|uniref:DUF397 domain-containing protein n=1 Tax=Streptomyces sp. NPDC056600 TaxID=3345874 RepID=UPI0036B48D83